MTKKKNRNIPPKRDSVEEAYNDFAIALENIYSALSMLKNKVDQLIDEQEQKVATLA